LPKVVTTKWLKQAMCDLPLATPHCTGMGLVFVTTQAPLGSFYGLRQGAG
jgi:hypothetical protein